MVGDVLTNRQAIEFAEQIKEGTMATITNILAAEIVRYRDNGQTKAYVKWLDSRGKTGTTEGDPKNTHMLALLARAEREGITVIRKAQG